MTFFHLLSSLPPFLPPPKVEMCHCCTELMKRLEHSLGGLAVTEALPLSPEADPKTLMCRV